MASHLLCSIVVLSLLHVAIGYEGCKVRYGRRGCHHRIIEGVLVTCNGHNVETIVPIKLPQDTVYMSLQNFQLHHLTRDSFKHLGTVQCLTIVDSAVGVVDSDAFTAMGALKELTLQNTNMNNTQVNFIGDVKFKPEYLTIAESPSVTELNFKDLENMEQLKTLDIHGNGIKELDGDIFEKIPNLERLDLSENGMGLFDWNQLHRLENLNQLYLHGNDFQTIPAEMYNTFFAVKELTLAGNQFHCNCKLTWMKEFFETAQDKKLDYEYVECASPLPSQRMQLKDVSEFSCQEPNVPLIHWVKITEDRFEVNCTSHSDPAPTLTLTLGDGQQVIVPPSTDLAVVNTTSPIIISIPGEIRCDAINSEGSASAVEQLPMPVEASSASYLHKTSTIVVSIFSCTLLHLVFRS